jgi:hypothetical protein
MSLVFKLKKNDGGFFSQMWHLLAYSIIAKKQSMNLLIDDSDWMFTHSLGWRDYFTSLSLLKENSNQKYPIKTNIDDSLLHQHTLNEYRLECFKVFTFQPSLQSKIEETLRQFNLEKGSYGAVMIRRGDKMYGESYYIPTEVYLKPLLEKNVNKIFVQTDDYNAYLEICKVVKDKNLSIDVFTTCPSDKFGSFTFNYSPEVGSTRSELNNEYLSSLAKLPKKKSVNQYTPTEMKEHVEEMLVGLEVCKFASILSTDFQSNVTRYLYLSHPNLSSVIAVDSIGVTMPLTIPMKCPAHGFLLP